MILVVCLAVLLSLGLVERLATRRARAAVPIRIHVNGTRGKSTVTRLIAAALREAGIATMAKVTGTAPRLILADGSERPIVRRAPANVREQAWLLGQARRAGAAAVVVECMAVRPDLQWASEREMVQATIGVITNARRDHTDVMGTTAGEIAQSLANTIPRCGILVAGDAWLADLLAGRCRALGTRLVVAEQPLSPGREPDAADSNEDGNGAGWWREDAAIALAVTRELGIGDEIALAGMRRAAGDPGAATSGIGWIAGRAAAWIDATAANDPDSLDMVVAGVSRAACPEQRRRACPEQGRRACPERSRREARDRTIVVYNHRADRPERLLDFARFSEVFQAAAAILLTGDRPALTLLASVRRRCLPRLGVRFVTAARLLPALASAAPADVAAPHIVFCGNTRGFVNPFESRIEN